MVFNDQVVSAAPPPPKRPQTSTGPKAPSAAPATSPSSGGTAAAASSAVSSAATNVRNALQGLARPAATGDLALDQPTAREQLATALSQTALSPLQAALSGEAPASPLRLEMDRMNSALLDGPPKQEEAAPKQEEAAAALDPRSLRETALAAGSRNKEQRVTRQTLSMGNGQYDELSPEQRAAVDFNRMLISAVHKDRKMQDKYDMSDLERSKYDESLAQVFGEDAPKPDMLAPETLGVLRQVGFHDDAATLDDFLSLNAAIGRKQIERMAPENIQLANEHTGPLAPGSNPAPGLSVTANEKDREKFDLAQTLAYDTGSMQAAMAKTQPLLATITDVAKLERNDDVTAMGGVANKVKPTVGYGDAQYDQNGVPQDLNSYFQLAFEKIASKEKDPKAVLADANSILTPEEFSQFHSYMANRAINAQRYELPLGANPEAKYMKPEQFIKLLNLDQPGGE